MNLFSLGLLICLCFSIIHVTFAHSFLCDPIPYNRVFRTKSCKGDECQQACPYIRSDESKMNNTIDRPAKVWKRGDNVKIRWTRNNHRGGMVRFSIVPVSQMMSRPAHKKYFIYAGCWDQGEYRCNGFTECGTDEDRIGFSRMIEIPKVIPDGIYIFANVWWGGLHYTRTRGDFADYYSCAYIKIEGGPFSDSYQPIWEDGEIKKWKNGGKCYTDADEPGECSPRTGCKKPTFSAVYRPFKDGAIPPALTPSDYGGTTSGSQDPSSTANVENMEAASGLPEMKKSGGICRGNVCCHEQCGKCGGKRCRDRTGGADNCCYDTILKSGRHCDEFDAPCYRS